MEVVQVNRGKTRLIESEGESYETGIFKEALPGRVTVTQLGLESDVIVDTRYHGGIDQALYLYGEEDYAYFSETFERAFEAGCFGENLTTRGLDFRTLCVGDVLTSHDLCLQVTAPRVPCNTLETRVGQRGFAKVFMQSSRCGAYCRVLNAGTVSAGDSFVLQPFDGDRQAIADFLHDLHRKLDKETLNRYLALPIDERNRADFEEALASLK